MRVTAAIRHHVQARRSTASLITRASSRVTRCPRSVTGLETLRLGRCLRTDFVEDVPQLRRLIERAPDRG
jgi:ribosomal protein L30/L7E